MPADMALDKTLGAVFVGILVSAVYVAKLAHMLTVCLSLKPQICRIYGVNCLQVYLYYTEHSCKDARLLKVFVSPSDFLDTHKIPHYRLVRSPVLCMYLIAIFGQFCFY